MMMVGNRLELRWGEKAERGVPAAAVVEDLDVVEDLVAQLGLGWPAAAVDELFLERREEALGDGVVVAVAAAAHRLRDPGGARLLAEGKRDELGEFTRSSQHFQGRSCDGPAGWLDDGAYGSLGDEVAGQAVASTRGRAVVPAGDREGSQQRRRRCRGGRLVSGWRPVVSRAWRDGDTPARPGLVPLSVLCRARGDCSAARRGQGRQGNRA